MYGDTAAGRKRVAQLREQGWDIWALAARLGQGPSQDRTRAGRRAIGSRVLRPGAWRLRSDHGEHEQPDAHRGEDQGLRGEPRQPPTARRRRTGRMALGGLAGRRT